jgi:hypothetical protein
MSPEVGLIVGAVVVGALALVAVEALRRPISLDVPSLDVAGFYEGWADDALREDAEVEALEDLWVFSGGPVFPDTPVKLVTLARL